tara:strand:+ start:4942 stop:5640 length:699 start_codon:yes stop_codon:yes gene_type:complete
MDNLEKKFFLLVKQNLFAFYVINEDDKILFKNEIFNNSLNLYNNFNKLKTFLDENIFEIEKKFNSYIEDINLIIDEKNFINIDITLLKNFKYLNTKFKNILSDLSNIKESVLKSNIEFQLAHMIINKYIQDKKEYFTALDQSDQKNFFLEIRLICLSKKKFINFKEILSIYQISIKKIFNYEYVNSFRDDSNDHIAIVASRLIGGLNKNEVNFLSKNQKNKGFFERFFKFFS